MKTYTNRSNAIRAARQTLGNKDAKLGEDFKLIESNGGFAVRLIVTAEPVMPEDRDALEIPAGLKISAAERKAGWDRNPPKPTATFAPSKQKAAKAKADKPKADNKIGPVIAKLKDGGVTVPEIHKMTGWKKIGGFYTAAKRAGLTLTKSKVDGVTLYRAA